MKKQILPFLILISSLSMVYAEVPSFDISSKQKNYKNFHFEVYRYDDSPLHKKYGKSYFVIAVTPGRRKKVDNDIYVSVWKGEIFIYSATLNKTTYEDLPLPLKKQIKNKSALLFYFAINPSFAGTWLSYQVRGENGHAEMNCDIMLKGYLK